MRLCNDEWAMVTGGLLWQWKGRHLRGCGGGGSLEVGAAFLFGAAKLSGFL